MKWCAGKVYEKTHTHLPTVSTFYLSFLARDYMSIFSYLADWFHLMHLCEYFIRLGAKKLELKLTSPLEKKEALFLGKVPKSCLANSFPCRNKHGKPYVKKVKVDTLTQRW